MNTLNDVLPVPPVQILVVIVNFRTPDITINCLQSLAAEVAAVDSVHVVVVENGSGDDSAFRITSAIRSNGWSSWIEFVKSDRNLGFAGGNNLGIERGPGAEFVLLLNSDTIVTPGCLKRCLDVMRECPRAGAMSCRLLNADGSIQNVARRFPTPLRVTCAAFGLPWKFPRLFEWADTEDARWDRSTSARDVDWLGGAFLFIRSAALDHKVQLDDDFFFYGEDVAFSHRLHQLGWLRRYDPVATTVHLGGASSNPTLMPSAARSLHNWRGRYLLQRKCYGNFAAQWTHALDLGMTSLRLIRAKLRRADGSERAAELSQQFSRISAGWKEK